MSQGTKAPSLFRGNISEQPIEVVEFHLGNYGLKSEMLKQLFAQAETQYETDKQNYSLEQTVRHILKNTKAKNFEEYNQPIEVLQQQKDWLIRMRNITAENITIALANSENIEKNNKFRNNIDMLIGIFNQYIRETQSQLSQNLSQ